MLNRFFLWTFAAAVLLTPSYSSAKHPHKSYRPHGKTRHYAPAPVAAPAPAHILSEQQERMLYDLGYIQNLFKLYYAPVEWKNEHLGWSLEQEFMNARQNIMEKSDLSIKEFQTILTKFSHRTQDHHVAIEYYSTESARLPFCIQKADGKYYVSYIDSSKTDPANLPFSLGDELVSFNDQETHAAVEEFKNKTYGSNDGLTYQALTEMYFTRRFGCDGNKVPQGDVSLIFKKSETGELVAHKMEWEYGSEKISDEFAKRTIQAATLLSGNSTGSKYSSRNQFITPHYNRLCCGLEKENEPSVKIGAKKNMLPALGEILQEAPEDMDFHAYLFKLPGGKTGAYVRIPTYELDGEKATPEFLEIIKQAEEKADVLVIDQLNNPGGNLLVLYSLLSFLTDQPLTLPMHRSKITQEDVYFANLGIEELSDVQDDEMAIEKMGTTTLSGYPVDLNYVQGLLKSQQDLIDQWNAGKTFTDFQYLNGVETITPNPEVHYTKPILVLVNSLAFSGGDFFPAILQDNHRAIIMGATTAGAGGKVDKFFFPNLNGIKKIQLTTSIALRSNGLPIENLGVTPDIPYEITAYDLQNNYEDFVAKILEVLESLL